MIWNRKENKLAVCLLAETNSAEDKDLEADLLHASSPETAEGWLLESRQMVRDEMTGRYIQFVSSKYGCPIRIYPTTDGEASPNIENISSQTEDQEMAFTIEEKTKSGMLLWVGIATAFLTLTVLIIALIVVVG